MNNKISKFKDTDVKIDQTRPYLCLHDQLLQTTWVVKLQTRQRVRVEIDVVSC